MGVGQGGIHQVQQDVEEPQIILGVRAWLAAVQAQDAFRALSDKEGAGDHRSQRPLSGTRAAEPEIAADIIHEQRAVRPEDVAVKLVSQFRADGRQAWGFPRGVQRQLLPLLIHQKQQAGVRLADELERPVDGQLADVLQPDHPTQMLRHGLQLLVAVQFVLEGLLVLPAELQGLLLQVQLFIEIAHFLRQPQETAPPPALLKAGHPHEDRARQDIQAEQAASHDRP
ncbi:MAG: hypothetical protein HYZ95_00005, partial [Candidatus Omnitrophica bacterium]|nr:hypothetical protein [Candidatus Omnitrophota bacterium]